MYYLYKRSKGNMLPKFNYNFKEFDEFYKIANVLTVPLVGSYFIHITSDSYDNIKTFINNNANYPYLVIYVEVTEPMLNYITLHMPNVQLLDSKSNFDVFKELVSKYNILLAKGCLRTLYHGIGHSYEEISEALELIKQTYPSNKEITDVELNELFVIDKLIYPRSVCIMYIRFDVRRLANLRKCVEYFGNDIVLFSMRKTARKLLEDKIKYYKTGNGNNLMKTLPIKNLIRMNLALTYCRGSFMDIFTIMNLYEKGVYVNDFIQREALPASNEKHYAVR